MEADRIGGAAQRSLSTLFPPLKGPQRKPFAQLPDGAVSRELDAIVSLHLTYMRTLANSLRFIAIVTVVCAAAAASTAARAQSSSDAGWHYVIEPYVMFPNVDGTIGIRNLPNVSLHSSPGDLFSHLQFGADLYLEAHNEDWAITSDLLYSNLAESAPSRPVITYARVDLKNLFWEPALLYRLSPLLQAGLGADLTALQARVNLKVNTPSAFISASDSRSITWVDPTVLLRGTLPLSQQWSLMLQGNVGGFNVNSKLTWQAQLYANYRLSELIQLSVGYRALGDNYDRGSASSRFYYKATTFGPVIRFAFMF